MNAVNSLGGNVHRAVETESHIGSPQVIVNGLGKGNDVKAFLPEKVRSLLASVAAKDHQALQLQFFIGMFHGLHFIQAVFIRYAHLFKWLPGGAQYGSALCQDTGKIRRLHNAVIRIHQSLVSVFKSYDFHIIEHIIQ